MGPIPRRDGEDANARDGRLSGGPSALPPELERRRPSVADASSPTHPSSSRGRVLAVGVVLADQVNVAGDACLRLAEGTRFDVDQRWIRVKNTRRRPRARCALPNPISFSTRRLRPKYELLNVLLRSIDLAAYDYLLVVDDDVILPYGFVDSFLTLQACLGFSLAQPARTECSFSDHPIVARHPGLVARQTRFVEQGPVLSVHRDLFGDVVPFDLRSPMGWGYEEVWSLEVERLGYRMGIIDATPVDHGVRKPVTNYSASEAHRDRITMLAELPNRPIEQCMHVVRAISAWPSGST